MKNENEISYLIAMDSFKGSLDSIQAANAVKEGILRVKPEAKLVIRPLADGGEGSVKALTYGMSGQMQRIKVTGPLGSEIDCEYGIVNIVKSNENTQELCAIIEIAAACGLYLVPEDKRNPLYTTTYGVGEIILDAFSKGCRKFIVGLGGSSTNDGGSGMLKALGVHFLDENADSISPGAIGLRDLYSIDTRNMRPELADCDFMLACDVDNPLCGELGSSKVFAKQKGADDKAILMMDEWLDNYADLTFAAVNNSDLDKNHKGAGAAGGLGFAFMAYLNASFNSGVELIIRESNMADYIKDADVVITGEGCLDGQTAMGKAPIGLAKAVKNIDETKKVIAFAGCLGEGVDKCKSLGIDEYYAITDYVHYDDNSLYMTPENAYQNLADLAETCFKGGHKHE